MWNHCQCIQQFLWCYDQFITDIFIGCAGPVSLKLHPTLPDALTLSHLPITLVCNRDLDTLSSETWMQQLAAAAAAVAPTRLQSVPARQMAVAQDDAMQAIAVGSARSHLGHVTSHRFSDGDFCLEILEDEQLVMDSADVADHQSANQQDAWPGRSRDQDSSSSSNSSSRYANIGSNAIHNMAADGTGQAATAADGCSSIHDGYHKSKQCIPVDHDHDVDRVSSRVDQNKKSTAKAKGTSSNTPCVAQVACSELLLLSQNELVDSVTASLKSVNSVTELDISSTDLGDRVSGVNNVTSITR